MYYRKYFAGSVEDASLTKPITDLANPSRTINISYIQADVICKAIQQTLQEVNISCIYDEDNFTLKINGVTIQFYAYASSYLYYQINEFNVGYNSSYSPFSQNKYRFYITLKGDIDSILMISIGKYDTPAYENNGIAIGNGTDLKDHSNIKVISLIGDALTSNFYLVKDDAIHDILKSKVVFGQEIINNPTVNDNGSLVTLVDCITMSCGRFRIDNCYFGNSALQTNYFYNIDGSVYYAFSSKILIKCVNQQLETE